MSALGDSAPTSFLMVAERLSIHGTLRVMAMVIPLLMAGSWCGEIEEHYVKVALEATYFKALQERVCPLPICAEKLKTNTKMEPGCHSFQDAMVEWSENELSEYNGTDPLACQCDAPMDGDEPNYAKVDCKAWNLQADDETSSMVEFDSGKILAMENKVYMRRSAGNYERHLRAELTMW